MPRLRHILIHFFNAVDHSILWKRLPRPFGIHATVHSSYESCVTGRTQAVHLPNTTTSQLPLVSEVTHGLVLEPLFSSKRLTADRLLHHSNADKTQNYCYCRQSECAVLKGNAIPSSDDEQVVFQLSTHQNRNLYDAPLCDGAIT